MRMDEERIKRKRTNRESENRKHKVSKWTDSEVKTVIVAKQLLFN